MRIVGGQFRGRTLMSPAGEATRPTSDRAREAIFNIICHAKWLDSDIIDNANVLDAFAGTGALGLEALSRGAAHACFIEQDRNAARACGDNIEKFGVADRCLILKADAAKPPPRPATLAPRTLVFLDPPYGKGLAARALAALDAKGWLADGAVCVVEMAKKEPEDAPAGFRQEDARAYGVALVKFLRKK